MDSITIKASLDYLPELMSYIKDICLFHHANAEQILAIELAVEEIVVNIISYAYTEDYPGNIELSCEFTDKSQLIITISDEGKAYNPLSKASPDINADIEQRSIGGLGIYLTRKMMDNVSYENKHGKNILKLEKILKYNDKP